MELIHLFLSGDKKKTERKEKEEEEWKREGRRNFKR